MSKVEIVSVDNYSKFINSLKDAKIISTDYNKLSFLVSNICIVYNINNEDVIYDDIIRFNEFYQNKLNKYNVKLILLNKYDNKVYKINNVIVCHSKVIKSIMQLKEFTDIINLLVNYAKFRENAQYYINEAIRELLICV